MAEKQSILELMKKRPVIGDGSYTITLEKRGYVKAGSWTPEVVLEHPEAVRQLHREFIRAGSDVVQVYSFYSADHRLTNDETGVSYSCKELNQKACELVREVSSPNIYICGGLSPTVAYKEKQGKNIVQDHFRIQCEIFKTNKVDLVLGEFFNCVEEAEWAIEIMRELGIPVACTMRVGPQGDLNGISPGDCAVRMVKAGADMIGLNCEFDPNTCIKTTRMMKEALERNKLQPFLMLQPMAFHAPEVENIKGGYHKLPEFPYCLEPRLLTRFDCRKYAREAYELGVHYFGGCCGFEPYHMREIAEELAPEIGKRPPGSDKSGCFGEALAINSSFKAMEKRQGREYWMDLVLATGRPDNPSTSTPQD